MFQKFVNRGQKMLKNALEILFGFCAMFCIIVIELYINTSSRSKKEKLEPAIYISGVVFIISILSYMLLYV